MPRSKRVYLEQNSHTKGQQTLAIDLKKHGVAVALLHPGWVNTDMVNFNGLIEPEEAAAGLIARMEELNLDNTGGFWHSNGDRLPW